MHIIYSLDDDLKQDVSIHRNHTPLYRGTANPTVIRAIHQQAVPQHPPASFPTSKHRSVTVIPRMIAILHSYKYMQTLQAHTLINKHTYQPTICAMSLDHTIACCFTIDCLSLRPNLIMPFRTRNPSIAAVCSLMPMKLCYSIVAERLPLRNAS